MVQKTTPSSGTARKRGRPPKFDVETVVAAAIGAFWARGFEATTLTDLEEATGVDRSTLYNSFGGKAGLYDMATSAYLTQAETGLFGPLFHGGGGYPDLIEFLGRLRAGLTSPEHPPGCLIVNDMAAGPDPRAAARYVELLEAGLRAALGRTGCDDDEILNRSKLIASSVIGINLVSRAGGDLGAVDASIDALVAEVRGWAA